MFLLVAAEQHAVPVLEVLLVSPNENSLLPVTVARHMVEASSPDGDTLRLRTHLVMATMRVALLHRERRRSSGLDSLAQLGKLQDEVGEEALCFGLLVLASWRRFETLPIATPTQQDPRYLSWCNDLPAIHAEVVRNGRCHSPSDGPDQILEQVRLPSCARPLEPRVY
jgi:hypothetical protein